MDHSARDAYLEAQIMTATPQKLRLMLIEAALRYARVAREALAQDRRDEAFEATIRCRRLVTELVSAVDPDYSALNRQVVALYVYLFRALTESQLRHDPAKMLDVIRVLEIERETWQQVCEKMPLAVSDSQTAPAKEIVTSAPAILPDLGRPPQTLGSFLLDA